MDSDTLQLITWGLMCLSLVGVVLNVKKNIACFYIWIIANSGWVIIDLKQGLPAQAMLFVVYALTCFWGIYEWRKEPLKESLE